MQWEKYANILNVVRGISVGMEVAGGLQPRLSWAEVHFILASLSEKNNRELGQICWLLSMLINTIASSMQFRMTREWDRMRANEMWNDRLDKVPWLYVDCV